MAECLLIAMINLSVGVIIGVVLMGWIKKNVYADGYNAGYNRAQRDERAL